MNLNAIRIDNGQPLTEADIDASIARTPREITPDEADAIAKAWERRQDINYVAHTSECADCDDYDEPPMPIWAGWALVAIMAASAASMVSLIVWVLP